MARRGPNSGGVTFHVLWRGHLFRVEQDFSSGAICPGIPAAQLLAAHRETCEPRCRQIVEALVARGE